jgi:hypothetical protein
MATALMAHPELRLPFEEFPIQPEDSTTVLYQGRKNTLSETGDGDGLLIRPEDLTRVNGFELEPEGACLGDRCIPLKNDLLVGWGGRPWFGLAAFTNLLEQPHVADRKALIVTWSSW